MVAHATVLRLTASPTSSPIAGGTERRPSQTFSNSQRWLKLAEAVRYRSAFTSTTIRAKSGAREGEHLARRGCSPPVFPLLFASDVASSDQHVSDARIQGRIEVAIQQAIEPGF